MKTTTKIIIIISGIIMVGLSLIVGVVVWYFFKAVWPTLPTEQFCGGIAGISCPSGYECQLDDDGGNISDAGGRCVQTNQADEPINYNPSYGSTCPIGIKFRGAKNAPEIKCQCPAGYTMNSEIIGYSSGDTCYGPGTECPILSSECILE